MSGKSMLKSVASSKPCRKPTKSPSTRNVPSRRMKTMPPVVSEWFEASLKKGIPGIIEEFRTMRSFQPADLVCTAFTANPTRNRYKDVTCLDATRVVLQSSSDYIHANFVKGSLSEKQFICAQGPLDDTITDFWRMVWQEKATVVLMLCEVVEKTKTKCAQYWPLGVGETKMYGPFRVKNVSGKLEKLAPTTSVRHTFLELTNMDEPTVRCDHPVQHFQWPDWPDRGIPPDTIAMMNLHKNVIRAGGCPVIVHCSAGIGRTGTFCAIDVLFGQVNGATTPLDVLSTVKTLRSQRLFSVQNEAQYTFIYRLVIDYIARRYNVPISNPALQDFWAKHSAMQNAIC